MPELNSNQFREFAVERHSGAVMSNEADPFAHSRGYQNYSSNAYSPAFSGSYNSPPEMNRSSASAESYGDEEED